MPKNFLGEPFSVSLISGIEKLYASEGYVTIFDFLSNLLSHSAENFRRGTFYCCINFGYRKSLDKRGGGGGSIKYQDFLLKIFCLTVPKISVGNPLLLH